MSATVEKPALAAGDGGATPEVVLSAGTVFRSKGLNAICEVTQIGAYMLEFRTERGDFASDIAIDVAVAHVRSGRWRVLS
jgi:hypothetical protein